MAGSAVTRRCFKRCVEPPRGILGGEQPPDWPLRIGERGLDGMKAVKQDAVGIGRPAAGA